MENIPENGPTEILKQAEKKKLVKELLDWCYDHTFIKNLRGKKGNKDTLLHCKIPMIANGGSANTRDSPINTYEGKIKFISLNWFISWKVRVR